MALYLGTTTNPGVASWLSDAHALNGESLLLFLSLVPADPTPTIDPDGRTSICFYMADAGAFTKTVELPQISSTVPAVWHFTIGADNIGSTIEIVPHASNVIANVALNNVILSIAPGPPDRPTSATLVHDGVSTWALFNGAVSLATAPVNLTAPVISFAAGDNSVGVLCSCTTGTWTSSPTSYSYDWQIDGVSIGAPDLSTYTPVPGDAGTPGVSSVISCVVTATNAIGSTPAPSNDITIRPYWLTDPVISGENWPGGSMGAVRGSVVGETSQSDEWEVAGVGTGTIGVTYVPVPADVGLNATFVETATNAGGSTPAVSNAIAIVQVDGVNRAGETGDWVSRSTVTMPTACTILIEYIGFSASANGLVISWGRQPGGVATRREMGVLITSTGNLQGLLRNSSNLGVMQLSPGSLLDGTTRHMFGFDQDSGSSTARLVHMVPFGAVTSTTAFASGGYQNPGAGTVNQFPTLFRRQADLITGGLTTDNLAAIINIAVLDRKLAAADYTAIAAAGSLAAWGAYTDTDNIFYIRPAADQVEGAAVTAAAQLIGSTWTINAGAADLTLGGLNVAV